MKRSTQLLVPVVLLLLLACSKDQFIQFESGEQIDLSEGITHLIPGDIKALHDDKDLLLIDNLAKDDPSTFTSFARSKTITIPAGSHNALQDAIDNSDAGDRIILESGDHTQDGTVLVNKSITAILIENSENVDDIVVSDLVLGGVIWASDNSSILPIDNATVFAPGGLTTDGESVWVADWGTGLIWQIDFDGKNPGSPFIVASDLSNPEGLAWHQDGSLLVVESGAQRLTRIDPSTGDKSTIADDLEISGPGLEGFPPTWAFDGVAIGPSGNIYVSGGAMNVIYRIRQN